MIQLRKAESGTRCCDFCEKIFEASKVFCPNQSSSRDICFHCVTIAAKDTPKNKSLIDRTISMFSAIAKRLLDQDTQKLVKAGFLNSDLSLTPKGEEHVLSLMLVQNKANLVAEAEEVIKELESEKK